MARAKAEGKHIGRPRRVVALEELKRLRAQGLSIRQIARSMEVPSSTVAKRLKLLGAASENSGGNPGGAIHA